MSNPKRPQPAVPSSLPINIGDLTLKLEPDTKLSVTVITPEKPVQPLKLNLRLLIAAVVILFFAWALLNWYYVIPIKETAQPIEFQQAGLAVTVTYPAYATFKDELELTLNITNRGTEEFTGSVTLLFQGAPAYPLPAESATAKLEKLAAGAGVSHRLKFALRQTPRWFSHQAIQTALNVKKDERTLPLAAGPAIAVAAHTFPLRTLNLWLGNSVALGVIAALLWEVMRKRFFGWEAK